MKIAFYTLGCKVNQYETQIMQNQFAADGFDIVSEQELADVYVINSCTVTSSGDKKTKQMIRRFKRLNDKAIIALTGCFPQAFPIEAAELMEVDVLQGASNRKAILSNVKKAIATGERVIDIVPHTKDEAFEPMTIDKLQERTRAFIKIEDGCDRYCSYCIIPKARGVIRSKPIEDIKRETAALIKNGYREIVLVGINLSSYGKGSQLRLVDAVEAVAAVCGVRRIRLGSLEPELLLDEDLQRMAKIPQFCDQFHLSLQSGCDDTLKRMNRHYNGEEYYDLVKKIRAQFKNPAITTDIVVGFAGETDDEFMQSVEFAKKVMFAKAHIFAFSLREGTRAATMENQVPQSIKEKRSKIMIEETNKVLVEFLKTQIGSIQEVLFEVPHSKDIYVGYTKNYTKVLVFCQENLCGEIKNVSLLEIDGEHCIGELVK